MGDECCSLSRIIYSVSLPSPPRVKIRIKMSKRGEKATTIWIYNVRVTLLFKVKFHFHFNALLCVKFSHFLLLNLKLPELSISRHVLRVIFKVLGLVRSDSVGYTGFLVLKYIYFLRIRMI